MEEVLSNPDYATACSMIQYYGAHLPCMFPMSHRYLADMMASDPENAYFLRQFKMLIQRLRVSTAAARIPHICTTYLRLTLNLNDDDVAQIRDNPEMTDISMPLKLKLLVGSMQEVVFRPLTVIKDQTQKINRLQQKTIENYDQCCVTPRLGFDPSTLDTFWYTIDVVLDVHVYSENRVTGKFKVIARNIAELDELIAKFRQRQKFADYLNNNDSNDESYKENSQPSNSRRRSRRLSVAFKPKPAPYKPTQKSSSVRMQLEHDSILARLLELRNLPERLARMSLPERAAAIIQPLLSDDERMIVDDATPQSATNNGEPLSAGPIDIHPSAIHFNDAIVWRSNIDGVLALAWHRVRDLQRSVGTSSNALKKRYIQQVRSVLERNVHIWEGGCTSADYASFDAVQALAQQCIDADGITVPLESLATRRHRITLCKFCELVGDLDAMDALPLWAYKFVQKALKYDKSGDLHEGMSNAENSFVVRASRMYTALPAIVQTEIKSRLEMRNAQLNDQWLKRTLEREL